MVGPATTEVAQRLYGFDLQLGASAMAKLRLMAEMIDLGATGTPRLLVTDTLSDPHVTLESGQGIYKEVARQQAPANEVKRATPITALIGNLPYKEKEEGGGSRIKNARSWIYCRSANLASKLAGQELARPMNLR